MMITRDDLIRSGACFDEVESWRKRHAPDATAIAVIEALRVSTAREQSYISIAAGMDGYGYGDGYGGDGGYDGYGGDGYGGYGGDGYGDGYGGDGGYDGYGGDGYGGYGYGDGYGGDGYGGYGYGDG